MDPSWDALDDFVRVYTETMHRVNANAYYFFGDDHFLRTKEEMGNVFHLATVRIDGTVACAGLFSEICGIVQFHLSGTGDEFVRMYPSKIMLDFVRNWAKERGNKVFHLGGGYGGVADSLFDFKAGFSKLRKPFCTWRVVVDQVAYDQLVEQREDTAEAEQPDEFFPAYRRPRAVHTA
jgi:hypothetical protein